MNSSIFASSEDPWENGWAAPEDDSRAKNTGDSLLYSNPDSSYLTSSQLLNSEPTTSDSAIPESYKRVYGELGSKIETVDDLKQTIFDKLIKSDILTNYQITRIIDILYDYNLLPPSIESNFYQILGLIALEIDLAGTGDYVTLQFKLNTRLPDIAGSIIELLISNDNTDSEVPQVDAEANFIDPLTSQLNETSINDNEEENEWSSQPISNTNSVGATNKETSILSDPILTDHSSIQQKQTKNEFESSNPEPIEYNEITKYIDEIRDRFKPLVNTPNTVRIKEVPEKEGLLFKHINYIITHDLKLGLHGPAGTKKVIRRYSDFVWLLEYLLKKYPFRVIPGLPPKKFSVGSSPDSQFLQRRRRGLHRFLNQLVKHPVLRQEPLVITFLSVPTDLNTWKKQARIDYSLEFKGQKISTNFINSIWPTIGEEFLKNWKNCETNINKLIEIWTKLVVLVERYEKRQQQIAFDNGKFVEMINKFNELDDNLYPHKNNENTEIIANNNKDDVNSINDSLHFISEFFNKSNQALIDESYNINTTNLEKFKNYLDYLYSLQELFERSKKLSINNINNLQNKIQENELKYSKLNTDDVDIKGSELVKLRQVIINDKQEIFQQLNKDWLIKNCCFEEFLMFQETQFLISEIWIDWCKGRSNFQSKFSELFDNLNNEILNDMPLSR